MLYVEFPLIAPGLGVGAIFAFVLAFGDYFAPSLVGDPGSLAIGNLAANQFSEAAAWPLGAAIGLIMMLTVLLVITLPAMGARLYRAIVRRRGGIESEAVQNATVQG